MEALNISAHNSFLDRLNGKVVPTVPEAEAIERVFAQYGITEVWGQVQGITQVEEDAA
jgi:hypothetical protein